MHVVHETTFKALCPVNGGVDEYTVMITASTLMLVEDIRKVLDEYASVVDYQENITQQLADRLHAVVVTIGKHGDFTTKVNCIG